MGLASVSPNERDLPGTLVQRADAMLYQAKSAGRNRYLLCGLDQP
jgi:PleD family two-component response regulator